MKKLAYSLIAMAIAAFTFTSCEDVPSPFGEIVKPETGGGSAVIEPTGDGTEASPYNVAAVIEYVSGLGADVTSDKEVYIKGIVTEVTEKFGTQYGNATFVISDVESGGNKFTFYRGLYLGNTKYSKDTDTNIKDGDVVVICGKVVNYKGNTPETSQGNAYVVSINGQGGGTTPTPGGEDEIKTVTIADFNAAAESTSVWYQLTGTVKGLKDNDKYGNFDLEDATGSVYVYGLLAEKGGEKQKFQELAAAKGIKNGCKLTIIGNRGSFGDKIEVVNAYFVSVEAGSEPDTPTPSGTGDGTEANPYSVSAAIAKAEQAGVFVKAYIVGWVEGQVYTSGAHFDGTSSSATNILIAESASETDPAKCMPVQLPNGNIRTGLNLKDNSGNYKKEVILYGDIAKYFGVPGLKNTSYAKIGTTEIGTKPGSSSGGGDTPSGATTLDTNFKANGQGDWTISNVKALPDGVNYIWSFDDRYGMKASAYVSGTRYDSDSWLVSPEISLANGGTMTFKQALNYATSEYVHVMYTTTSKSGEVNANDWKEATVDSWPAGNNWTFIESKATLPAGTVRVAFRYTSTSSIAATWEIESANIK